MWTLENIKHLIPDITFRCYNYDHVQLKFYRMFNATYAKTKSANAEAVSVELLKSYCLLVLLCCRIHVTICWRGQHDEQMYMHGIRKIFKVSTSENCSIIKSMFGLHDMKTRNERRRRSLGLSVNSLKKCFHLKYQFMHLWTFYSSRYVPNVAKRRL